MHLNVDYPFTLTGVLYFQRLQREMQIEERKTQLYARQMFITDELTDIMPHFLRLLHGVIDSPDIPLNVSRSALQLDANVKRISNHIAKKVAEKLLELFKEQRKSYEEKWPHIGLFVKYGVMHDEKFAEKTRDALLLRNTEGLFFTIEEYKKRVATAQTSKDKKVVFLYTQKPKEQDFFVRAAQKSGCDVLVMDDFVDIHFINHLETKEEGIQWKRVDADTADKLIDKGAQAHSLRSSAEEERIKKCFEQAIADPKAQVTTSALSQEAAPVQIILSEIMRRMQDMSVAAQGVLNERAFTAPGEVVINVNHPVFEKMLSIKEEDTRQDFVKQLYDMALLSQNMLSGEALTSFLERNLTFLAEPTRLSRK